MREAYKTSIASVVAERWAAGSQARTEAQDTAKEPRAAFRAEVARDLFKALPRDKQKSYGDAAKKEALDAKAAYLKALKDGPPQDAESRQRYVKSLWLLFVSNAHRCIKELGAFMGPILQGLHAYTGLHSTIILGGPMPEFGGELRTTQYVS
jgi:hypothetical protein